MQNKLAKQNPSTESSDTGTLMDKSDSGLHLNLFALALKVAHSHL